MQERMPKMPRDKRGSKEGIPGGMENKKGESRSGAAKGDVQSGERANEIYGRKQRTREDQSVCPA